MYTIIIMHLIVHALNFGALEFMDKHESGGNKP